MSEGTLRGELPPLRDRDTGDWHADFHYRSYLEMGSPLCVTCQEKEKEA